MASISYWFLSPSVILALIGKLKGWDRTKPTPTFDWRTATLDVLIPAKNEESSIAFCLASLFDQDFRIRKVTVIDDASTDRTAQVVRRYVELSGKEVDLVVRTESRGKTTAVREQCENSNADAFLILDADTVLTHRNYASRLIENLFKNAGVASACGEVSPLTRNRRRKIMLASSLLARIQAEMRLDLSEPSPPPRRVLEFLTVMYRTSLYVFLQRILYDGHMKMYGSRLNPIGCAVVYRAPRLRECFAYAQPQMGDNLTNSEDIFIGHFFSWKGWRNIQVSDVRCESIEPSVERLPRQLYLWSSSFLQAMYYFSELPLSPLMGAKRRMAQLFSSHRNEIDAGVQRRHIHEQYRAPWGEDYTRRFGRPVGWVELLSLLEKVTYPVLLLYFALFNHRIFWISVGLEAVLASTGVFIVADPGSRWKSALMMLAATPIRLLSLGVDLGTTLKYLFDLGTGNREWKK
ncbi:MAG: glycosyltransferase family 2 protein [Acidobacteriia bacterium]|nr:glycosyltransferase family 2 protein [Terriglobia bacterium]